ncbi:MAG: GlxA family transcriptional regulator [Tateyamaria sp.]
MHNWSKIHDAMQHLDILLFDAFSNHCLANTIEPLRAANGFTKEVTYSWRFLSLDGATVRSSSGMQIVPHGALQDGQGNALVVMPSYGHRGLDQARVLRPLAAAVGRYAVLGGFDTGSWLLGRVGQLDGYAATIHWDELDAFSEAFTQIDVQRERFVVDRDRVTCSGAMAAFDLVTAMIAAAHGPLVAMDVAQLFMSRDATHVVSPRLGGRTVARAIEVMRENIETPLPIPAVAARVGCTQKKLEQRMAAALSATPTAVYRHLRLTVALRLVEDTPLSVSEIASRCGYENASAMTRAFRLAFGESPRARRQAVL